MAQEEIKLVGSFKDDITPKLKKLSKEISNIGRAFEKFNRNLRPISREFGRMAASAERFNVAMKSQRNALAANARAMGEYKKQAGRMAGAMRAMETQRAKAMRAQGVTRAQQKGGSGGVTPVPTTPAAGKGTGKAFGATAGASFKQSIGATAIGTTIGMMASQMIMGAASKIGNMISMPFKKFGDMFAERIGDEMDDIKSAGGLYALDMDLTQQSGNERFFKNYNEALRYQEKLNIDMAESAASLPGVTSQYVSTSRQLTDTIQMVMEKNREGFNEMAQKFGANVSMGGVEASKEAMRTVLQKQTEQVMLQSQGQQGGLPMHIMIQQLLGKEAKNGKLGIQAFTNRFRAAFQKNPLLKNFLMRAEEDLAKTDANSVERLQLLMETFDAAMPKEVINKMRGSISGMQEALRSGLFDPQAGLFGMSRANLDPKTGQKIMKRNVDDLGNFLYSITDDTLKVTTDAQVEMLKSLNLDKAIGDSLKGAELTEEQMKKLGLNLKVVGDTVKKTNGQVVGEVSKSSTYIFEQIREILAGYGPVLLEFVGFLPSLFDPFGEMTNNLKDFRDNAQKFIKKFNDNLQQFEDVALKYSQMADPEKQGLGSLLKKQSRSRAAFGTMAKFLESIGGIDKGLSKQIQDIAGATSEAGIKAVDEGALNKMFVPLFNSLINSDLMAEFGKIGGIIIGGITKAVVQMIKGVTTFAKGQGTNKLMQGFIDGFTQAFGDMSFSDAKGIITDAVVSVVSKGLDLLFTQVIPNLMGMYIQSLFQGLFSGNIVTTLFSALGLFKLGAMIAPMLSAVGAALTFLSPLLVSIGGILMTIITTVLLPVMAVAGAIMIVIAVVRNFGSILKMAGGAIKMIVGQLIEAASKYIGALGNIISWIPGLGKVGEGLKNAGEQMKGFGSGLKSQGFKDIQEAGSEMKRQFTQDAAAIKAKFTGMFPTMDATTMSLSQMNAMIGENVASIKAEQDARKAVTAFSLNNQGPSGKSSTYTVGGVEYDAATGLPVSSITSGATYTGASSKPMETEVSGAGEAMEKITPSAESASQGLDKASAATEKLGKTMEAATKTFEAVPPKVEEALVGAASSAGQAITTAAQGLAQALGQAAQSIKNAASAAPSTGDKAKGAYGGSGNMTRSMPLADAIATEKKNMPSGAGLVIANTSETIIPAFAGHAGDGFKGLSFAELESAAGFDRMASYTDQIAEIADKTAASFAGGFGGALGGGSATLNAMEALGHSFGLVTTSGHRPGDPGFHGVNRARDLSNGGGETPEMNAAAAKMASEFGSSLTELIYTPMGFSIKNGQKTGLISPSNHYHHIHVAVAEGLQKAAVFSSQRAAEMYERSMMPAGSEPMKVNLASMTANSSEFGGGGVTVGDINVSVSGVDDPKAIANVVAEEILAAIEKSTYSEVFTS